MKKTNILKEWSCIFWSLPGLNLTSLNCPDLSLTYLIFTGTSEIRKISKPNFKDFQFIISKKMASFYVGEGPAMQAF
jgi:hypothetical protein